MMRIRKDSHLATVGRFGVAPLICGGAVTAWAAYMARAGKVVTNGDFVLGITMSLTITLIGAGVLGYGWWLDWREGQQMKNSPPAAGPDGDN